MSEDLKAWAAREHEDAREFDALRDLRALVLRTENAKLNPPCRGRRRTWATASEWQAVVKAAADAVRGEVPQ